MPIIEETSQGNYIKKLNDTEHIFLGNKNVILSNETHSVLCDNKNKPLVYAEGIQEIGLGSHATTFVRAFVDDEEYEYTASTTPRGKHFTISSVVIENPAASDWEITTLLTEVTDEELVTTDSVVLYVSAMPQGAVSSSLVSVTVKFPDNELIVKSWSLTKVKSGAGCNLSASTYSLLTDSLGVIKPIFDVDIIFSVVQRGVENPYYKFYVAYDDDLFGEIPAQSGTTSTYTFDKAGISEFEKFMQCKVELYTADNLGVDQYLAQDAVSVIKIPEGGTGDDAELYKLEVFPQVIQIEPGGESFNPPFLYFASYKYVGSVSSAYAGIFKIYNSDGGAYVLQYTSAAPEALINVATITYCSAGIKNIKVELYNATGVTLLDTEIIPLNSEGNYILVLTNDNHTFSADKDGEILSYVGAETTAQIYNGGQLITSSDWEIDSVASAGITRALDEYDANPCIFTIVDLAAVTDSGTVSFTATHALHANLYATFSVSKAKTGADGADGEQGIIGPGLVYEGPYDAGQTYYSSDIRRDVVYYDGVYWAAVGESFSGQTPAEGAYWTSFGATLKAVATHLLLAEDALITKILTIGDGDGNGAIQSGDWHLANETGWRISKGFATFFGAELLGSKFVTANATESDAHIELIQDYLTFYDETGTATGSIHGNSGSSVISGSWEFISGLHIGDAGGNFGGALVLHNGTFDPITYFSASLTCANDEAALLINGEKAATEDWVNSLNYSILPDLTGQTGKFLTNDGTDLSWGDPTPSGYNNSNWDTAYGWGDHSSVGYLTTVPNGFYLGTVDETHVVGSINLSDGNQYVSVTGLKASDWDTAYGWGDHSSVGYVTGTPWTSEGYVTGTPWTSMGYLTAVPNGFYLGTVDETHVVGSIALSDGNQYNSVTGLSISDWNTAYGWGSHASAGYLTSESDPVFTSSAAYGITSTNISNWGTAYGWGNHASAGYVTGTPWTSMGYLTAVPNGFYLGTMDETHVVGSISLSDGNQFYTMTGTSIDNWNDAYGWGNHASAGYLTSLPSHNHGSLSTTISFTDLDGIDHGVTISNGIITSWVTA
jgi:hypothetical protein